MSVIVKGMEMPTCCARCELAHDLCWCMAIMGDDGHFYDSQYGEYGFDIQKARLPKCPLVEIPNNHGRLIDADAFAKHIQDVSIKCNYKNVEIDGSLLTVADVFDAVVADLTGKGLDGFKDAPTILEAESEEEQ